jgi:hypothetical protein
MAVKTPSSSGVNSKVTFFMADFIVTFIELLVLGPAFLVFLVSLVSLVSLLPHFHASIVTAVSDVILTCGSCT